MLVGVWCALILVMAACSGGSPATSDAGGDVLSPSQPASETSGDTSGSAAGSPVDGARAFLERFISEDDVTPYQCAALNAQNSEILSPFPDLPGAASSIDVSELVYTVTSESGDTAKVTLTGKAVVTLTIQGQDAVQEYDYDSDPIILKMKNENGWKVCT